MILSTLATWNFEYALQLQSMKTDIFSLRETSNAFIYPFCHSKIHSVKIDYNNIEFFSRFVSFISSMESLSKG